MVCSLLHNRMNTFISIIILMSLTLFLCFPVSASAQTGDGKQSCGTIDLQRILGRWVRSDGGYVLELKNPGKDGILTAAYYNPASINVSRAEWHHDNGTVNILVELRDVNYPGSTYTLRYDTKSDRLIGTYFQAMDKITYDIEFLRSK